MTLVNARAANDNPDAVSSDRNMSPFVRRLSEEFRADLAGEVRSFKLWFTAMLVGHGAVLVLIIEHSTAWDL